MPVFNYLALNTKTGKNVSGAMEAADEAALDAKLTGIGFSLTKATKVKVKKKLFEAISRRDMIDFYTLMIFQVRSGLSSVEAVKVAGGECQNQKLKDILKAVERKIRSGLMFFESIDGFPEAFPPNVVNMVRAGEMSCKLPNVFQELKEYEEWREKMNAEIRQVTRYPLIVLCVITAFVLLLFTLVIPKFETLMNDLKLELPLITKIIFGASDFALSTWWIIVILGIGIPVGIKKGRKRSEWFTLQLDRIMLMLPGFGSLNLMISISRLTHNLSSLVGAGLTVLDALHHCRELVGNKVVEFAVRDVKAAVTAGVDLSEAMGKHKIFPEMVLKMVALGETTGFLDDALENASEFYNQAIPRKTKKLFGMMEPIMMLGIIGLLAAVALSIFLPIVEMMNGVGRAR